MRALFIVARLPVGAKQFKAKVDARCREIGIDEWDVTALDHPAMTLHVKDAAARGDMIIAGWGSFARDCFRDKSGGVERWLRGQADWVEANVRPLWRPDLTLVGRRDRPSRPPSGPMNPSRWPRRTPVRPWFR